MNMENRAIPRQEWPEFFQGFSKKHMNWLVTVELLDPKIGDQVLARDFALQGISVDAKRLQEGSLSIFLTKGEDEITHTVAKPEEIRLKRSFQGADEALEILSSEGSVTLLTFRVAIPTEKVDGFLPPSGGAR